MKPEASFYFVTVLAVASLHMVIWPCRLPIWHFPNWFDPRPLSLVYLGTDFGRHHGLHISSFILQVGFPSFSSHNLPWRADSIDRLPFLRFLVGFSPSETVIKDPEERRRMDWWRHLFSRTVFLAHCGLAVPLLKATCSMKWFCP